MMRIRRRIGIGIVVMIVLLLGAFAPGAAAESAVAAGEPQQATPALPENGAIAQVNDIEMYYEVYGEGEPLLLIHTDLGSVEDFALVIPAFIDAGYQVIAMDCRGRGRSTDAGQPFSYALMASDVMALMDELGIEKADIVGEADGGIIGLHMAIHDPERVGRLVSWGANFNPNGFFPDFEDFVESITLADFDTMFGDAYRRLAPNPDYLPVLLEKLRHQILTQPDFTLEQLMSIRSPVLVFDGEDEDVIRLEHVRQLAAAIPDATLVIQPGAGHHLLAEQPQVYLDTVLPFLAGELDAPPVGKYAKVNDIAMYYEIYGEGEPLLLIHSVAASMAQLSNAIPVLAEDYQVIVVDFRGHGRTTDSGQPLSYELVASDVVALMDTLGIDAADIVGNKDGGIVGLVMATQYPERVKKLVAASVNYSPAGFQPWFGDWVKSVTLDDWHAMTGDMYAKIAPDPSIEPVMLEKDRILLLTGPNLTLEELSTITAPTLVMAGADEEVLQITHVEELAAAIPNADLVLIPEAGHGVLEEQFEAWMEAVNTFLAEQTSPNAYAHPEMLVDTAWLADHLADPHLRILDTRNFLAEGDVAKRLAAYETGHIPGAVYVDARDDISDPNGDAPLLILPADEFEALMGRLGIGNDTTVVVYDDAGNTWSARLWWALRYYGHDNVKLLDGGLTKWTLEERPLETESNEPTPTTFRAEVRPALLATKMDVLAAIDDPDVAIIDSLAPEFFSGEWTWPNMRGGHIPTADNFFVMDNLDPANLTLLPAQSLVELWQKIDLKPDQEIITYCGAGYYGAFNVFVLYQLGYNDVRLYDGSWMEWGADLTLPVEVAPGFQETPTADTSQTVPRYEPSACKYSFPEGEQVECGYLVVPEDRTQPDSPTIRLHVVNLKSRGATTAPDPIILIPGGPGANGPFYIWLWTETPIADVFRAERDTIMLEHRGANFSEPAFYCPEMEADLADVAGLSFAEEIEQSAAAYRACHDRLVAEGHNLSVYSAVEAAVDIAGLRVAMGYDEVNVYGVSYGTLPAMHLLRDHPEGIRSVVLDSVWPPDLNQTNETLTVVQGMLDAVFAACAADEACDAAYPDLETVFVETLAQLRAEPVTVTVQDEAGQSYDVTVDDLKFVQYVYDSGFAGEDYGTVPAAMYSVRNGDLESAAQGWLGYVGGRHGPTGPGSWASSMGLYNSVMCLQDGYGSDAEQAAALYETVETDPSIRAWAKLAFAQEWLGPCAFWDVAPTLPEAVHAQVVSDIPTLMTVNTFDIFFGPYFGDAAAAGLSRGYLYELPMSHASVLSDCALGMMTQFWRDPTQAPDAGCIGELTLNWVLPE